ncbi:hypothetical protein ABEG79_22710 [Pantoea agglomerans]|uniref:hypothetical protein n=1 Tax=Enterobacter agglomerans TaxID=549 RepID=UPI00165452D0|nr:hypothetical protein [Pantoea agglomerans]
MHLSLALSAYYVLGGGGDLLGNVQLAHPHASGLHVAESKEVWGDQGSIAGVYFPLKESEDVIISLDGAHFFVKSEEYQEAGDGALVIEEGLATAFSEYVIEVWFNETDNTNYTNDIHYRDAVQKVRELLKQAPDAIDRLRKIECAFSNMTAATFESAGLNVSKQLISELLRQFSPESFQSRLQLSIEKKTSERLPKPLGNPPYSADAAGF